MFFRSSFITEGQGTLQLHPLSSSTLDCRTLKYTECTMSFNNTTVAQGANMTQMQPIPIFDIVMEPSWLVIVRLSVESLIALAGIIGNFVVCFAITKHRTLNTAPTNMYIRNVAVGDLATLLVAFPLGIIREHFTYWPLGEFACRYLFPLSDIFFGVSVWSITAIAVDSHRILAAIPRLALRSMTTPRIACAAIWLASFLAISLPLVLVYEYQQTPGEKPACYPVWPNANLPLIYSIAMSLFTYVIPLSLILVTYFTIKRKLCKSESFHMEMADNSTSGGFRNSQVYPVKTLKDVACKTTVGVIHSWVEAGDPIKIKVAGNILLSQISDADDIPASILCGI
ncbi:hypothetical protein OS493_024344 [Desmophyllum pertusum]|uniref:G-protein coupled receptors family 1 profile domain-containing protein n=1 Tax=Desmophyllum pertusum TaxID=174260 RepID=A0A9W9YPW0_9CNID|nr:hypothetical protein OS493_024344 [Desmophyllum pertusum]